MLFEVSVENVFISIAQDLVSHCFYCIQDLSTAIHLLST